MSMAFSGTMQGSFIQADPEVPVVISLRSGFSWMWVYNQTVIADKTVGSGARFYFDPLSMTNGSGIVESYLVAAGNPITMAVMDPLTGFFTFDSSVQQPAASQAITDISGDPVPLVTAGTVTGLVNGDIVRIYRTVGAQQLEGIDFTIGNVDVMAGTFELSYMDQIIVAAGPGTYRKIPFNPIYYPRNRTITHITNDTEAVVTTSVTHGYFIGQKVQFLVPAVDTTSYGMTEINNLTQTIIAVDRDANTFTIDLDTSGFSTWAFPTSVLAEDTNYTPAQVVPAGIDTATQILYSQSQTDPSYIDAAQIGVILMPGVLSPGGVAGDKIEWVAGTSWNV